MRSLEAVKITAIQTNTGSEYLRNHRVFGTPNKIGFVPLRQLDCNCICQAVSLLAQKYPL